MERIDFKRGRFKEILLSTLPQSEKQQVVELVNLAKEAAKVDEHGSWEFGGEVDHAGRGSALNWDLYAIGSDYHSNALLIVIQIRHYFKAVRRHFPSIRKNYYLLGKNEDNTVFAHPVESRVIHHAIKKDADVILAVQKWIFGSDYTKVIRQGDIALIRVKRPLGELQTTTEIVLEDSHKVSADEIFLNGIYHVKNPVMVHMPNTHPQISGEGWYKVKVGNRAKYWKFAAPTAD
jgi:hypothetical protein